MLHPAIIDDNRTNKTQPISPSTEQLSESSFTDKQSNETNKPSDTSTIKSTPQNGHNTMLTSSQSDFHKQKQHAK